MSGDDNFNLDTSDKRRTLWIVLWLNVAIAVGFFVMGYFGDSNALLANGCLLYTSPSPRDKRQSRMPSSA